MYTRISPPFCFNIPNPDIQIRQIPHPKKTRLLEILLTVSLSLRRGRWERGRSSVSILAFTLLLFVSSYIIYFYFTVKTAEHHLCLPNKKLALFPLQTASLWSRNPFCHHTNRTRHLKRKSGIINFSQSPGDVYLYVIEIWATRVRQTSDSSWQFLEIENEQIKTAQNNSYGWKIARNNCLKLLIYT